jgi:hypothetical protein
MPVTVTPETFTFVSFDAAEIATLTERLRDQVGLPAEAEVRVEVDETTPLSRALVTAVEPITISVESGALEDPKKPRHVSTHAVVDSIGRLLLRVRDRLDPSFGEPPPDSELSLPQAAAWDAYSMGRLSRHGHRAQRQRRLYHFRNRHGFTDVADAAFARLWDGEQLSWNDIDSISAEALEHKPTAA